MFFRSSFVPASLLPAWVSPQRKPQQGFAEQPRPTSVRSRRQQLDSGSSACYHCPHHLNKKVSFLDGENTAAEINGPDTQELKPFSNSNRLCVFFARLKQAFEKQDLERKL